MGGGQKTMRSKILIALGLVAAFVVGTIASTVTTSAFTPRQEEQIAVATPAKAVPVARTRYVAPRAVTVVDREPTYVAPVAAVRPVEPVEQKKTRSWEREVLIVGGSAGAGAAIGAVAGGKKGAGIGALSGGIAGLVYDIATRNK
jgi:uncharacterized protein YcfJ